MPAAARPRRQPTDDWQQLRLLVASPEQETYELLRPVVRFGQPVRTRSRETGVSERILQRKVARFDARGMRSLVEAVDPPVPDRRRLPLGIRRAIVELKAEYPPLGLREIAAICRERFARSVSHHTVKQVLATEPLPLHPPRRLPRYRDIPDPVQRRKAVVNLYLEGWRPTAIAGYLETTRTRVYETLARWEGEGWPGLEDRSRAPHPPARTVDLKAMAAIRRLQANPELGEFRVHAALAQLGIDLSPRTCGRILALHRELGAPRSATARREARPMPFAAVRRHQFWSVDVRYIEDHALGTGKPAYAISILENFSRALLASAVSPRQDLTASLIVLRAAIEAHGAPEVLVSDGGGIFRATHAGADRAGLGGARPGDRDARPDRSRRAARNGAARRSRPRLFQRAAGFSLQMIRTRRRPNSPKSAVASAMRLLTADPSRWSGSCGQGLKSLGPRTRCATSRGML